MFWITALILVEGKVLRSQKNYHCNITVDWSYAWCLHRRNFQFLTKRHIIDLFLKIQKHTNSTICKLTDEIRNLNVNFKRLASNIQACKKVNDALVKQVASLERQCWRNALYYRRESVEIIGMSNWIVHSVLEKTVCKLLQHIGADIFEEKLESYHLLNKKSDRTIVRFLAQKIVNR